MEEGNEGDLEFSYLINWIIATSENVNSAIFFPEMKLSVMKMQILG